MDKSEVLRILNEAKTEKVLRTGGNRNLLQEMYDREVVAIHPTMFAPREPTEIELLWKRCSSTVKRASMGVSLSLSLILAGTNGAVLHNSLLVWFVFGLVAFGSVGALYVAEKLDESIASR